MRIQLRGGHHTEDRRLDRLPQDDPRNYDYPIRALLRDTVTDERTYRYWSHGVVIDQGQEGACVGFGWTGEFMASPNRTHIGPNWSRAFSREDPNYFARNRVYKRAQQIDEWAGENYEGTSVLAGAKVARELGLITEYRWAFSMPDIRDALLHHGPVVIGVNWYYDMYDTDANGLVSVSGEWVGGHCLFLTGYAKERTFSGISGPLEVYRWRNSWGSDYGLGGTGFIRAADLERLIVDESGDACVPVSRITGNV